MRPPFPVLRTSCSARTAPAAPRSSPPATRTMDRDSTARREARHSSRGRVPATRSALTAPFRRLVSQSSSLPCRVYTVQASTPATSQRRRATASSTRARSTIGRQLEAGVIDLPEPGRSGVQGRVHACVGYRLRGDLREAAQEVRSRHIRVLQVEQRRHADGLATVDQAAGSQGCRGPNGGLRRARPPSGASPSRCPPPRRAGLSRSRSGRWRNPRAGSWCRGMPRRWWTRRCGRGRRAGLHGSRRCRSTVAPAARHMRDATERSTSLRSSDAPNSRLDSASTPSCWFDSARRSSSSRLSNAPASELAHAAGEVDVVGEKPRSDVEDVYEPDEAAVDHQGGRKLAGEPVALPELPLVCGELRVLAAAQDEQVVMTDRRAGGAPTRYASAFVRRAVVTSRCACRCSPDRAARHVRACGPRSRSRRAPRAVAGPRNEAMSSGRLAALMRAPSLTSSRSETLRRSRVSSRSALSRRCAAISPSARAGRTTSSKSRGRFSRTSATPITRPLLSQGDAQERLCISVQQALAVGRWQAGIVGRGHDLGVARGDDGQRQRPARERQRRPRDRVVEASVLPADERAQISPRPPRRCRPSARDRVPRVCVRSRAAPGRAPPSDSGPRYPRPARAPDRPQSGSGRPDARPARAPARRA